MINKIGVENFRVFKEYTEFEIRPITLLTGPNNSGKSSLTKLLLLLKNGINDLNFEEGNHNLENFESVVNWENNEKIIKVTNFIDASILGKNIGVEFSYENNIIVKIIIHDKDVPIISFSFKEEISENFGYANLKGTQNVDLNILYIIQKIFDQEIMMPNVKRDENGSTLVFKPLNEQNKLDYRITSSNLSEEEQFWHLIKNAGTDVAFLFTNSLMSEKIGMIDENFLLYDLYLDEEIITEKYESKLIELQNKTFSNLEFNYNNFQGVDLNDKAEVLHFILNNLLNQAEYQILSYFKNIINNESVTIKFSPLGELIFKDKLFDANTSHGKYYSQVNWDKIAQVPFFIGNNFKQIHYISPHRGNHRRILQNKSENDMDEIVLEFSKKDLNKLDNSYLIEVMKILEVPGEVKVERFLNYISVIYLQKNEKKIPLADIGYGFSQLIPIVLKIFNLFPNDPDLPRIDVLTKETLILEEPEANLHPNLQSKLADLLALSLAYYPGMQFIVETHSEYLIRKLQYLTAKKELQPDQSVIYYFNADKYVSREEPKVKKIEITPTGNLTDTFGPGFYDEATRLKFDLMHINKEQNN